MATHPYFGAYFAIVMEQVLRRYGILCAFSLFVFIVYEISVHRLTLKIEQLSHQIEMHEMLKFIAMEEKEKLHLQLKSQDDPAWCELLLMNRLGLCPQQDVKIYFKQATDDR